MIFAFLIVNISLLILIKKNGASYKNPASVYIVAWTGVVVLHEIKLIYYDDLSFLTWFVIFLSELCFVFGCHLGKRLIICKAEYRKQLVSGTVYDNIKLEKYLRNTILVLSAIAAISIVSGITRLLSIYGTNILGALAKANDTYYLKSEGTQVVFTISYLPSFAYLGTAYAGIYCKKFGFRVFVFAPIALVALHSIGSGNRYGLVIGLLLFVAPFFYGVKKQKVIKKNHSIVRKSLFIVCVCIILYVFFSITTARSTWIEVNQYTSPILAALMRIDPGIYKNYHYVAQPVGVLNAYLANPYSKPPGSITFAFIYNILNRFGIRISRTAPDSGNYYIPIRGNAGTYLTGLFSEFSILAFVACLLFGLICGYAYKKANEEDNLTYEGLYVVLFSLMVLTIFTWYLSETMFWISMFFAVIIGRVIDKKCKR